MLGLLLGDLPLPYTTRTPGAPMRREAIRGTAQTPPGQSVREARC
jgi:hypothetical protein